ncbi:unnamed protein product, partial [Owenia fusiformis]
VFDSFTISSIQDSDIIPSNWQEFLSNRQNKKIFVHYFSDTILKVHQLSNSSVPLFVSGGFADGELCKVCVSNSISLSPLYQSNSMEGDFRIWLHAHLVSKSNILIFSKDTDSYMIGLPLDFDNKRVLINIGGKTSNETYISISNLRKNILTDVNLHSLNKQILPKVFQSIFIATGCDYVSSFKKISKTKVFSIFYQYATFIISSSEYLGSLHQTGVDDYNLGFLSFIRLVGCLFFTRCNVAFHDLGVKDKNPTSLFKYFAEEHFHSLDQSISIHRAWLSSIREKISERETIGDNLLPSFEALLLHWKRACWVSQIWSQSIQNTMHINPIENWGWEINDSGKISFTWDSKENMNKAISEELYLTKGCGCKKDPMCSRNCGCKTNFPDGCGPACLCQGNCFNPLNINNVDIDNNTDDEDNSDSDSDSDDNDDDEVKLP